jgi:hypothetical protein
VSTATEAVKCMKGCTADHSEDGFPEDRACTQWLEPLALTATADDKEWVETRIAPQLFMEPHADDPRRRVPYAALGLCEELWCSPLDPAGLAEVIGKFTAFTAVLQDAHELLVQALAEHEGAL